MKIEMRYFRKQRDRSGQVLAEAAIGLALMALTWILLAFATFIATNHLRTNMAARHAAWFKGETAGREMSSEQINRQFFYQDLAQVHYTEGVGITEIFTDPQNRDENNVGNSGDGPFGATVTFGITDLNSPQASQYPYALLKTRLPFMPASAPDSGRMLSVKSHCQWDEVGNTWESGLGALQWLWKKVKAAAKGLLG